MPISAAAPSALEGFCHVVNDRRLANLPMILETPKEIGLDDTHWNTLNIKQLKDLCHRNS
jgi:hypothetical protein